MLKPSDNFFTELKFHSKNNRLWVWKMGFFMPWNAQTRDVLRLSSGCKHTTEVLCIWESFCSQMKSYTQIQWEFCHWTECVHGSFCPYSGDGKLMKYSHNISTLYLDSRAKSYERITAFPFSNQDMNARQHLLWCHLRSIPALKTEVLNSTRRTRMA